MVQALTGNEWTWKFSRDSTQSVLHSLFQSDVEEFAVENVLTTLTSLSDLGLFQKMKLWELVGIIAPLTCHPNIWIRYGAIGFIASTFKHLPQTDIWCIIYPLLTPFLISDVAELNEIGLLENIRSPVSNVPSQSRVLILCELIMTSVGMILASTSDLWSSGNVGEQSDQQIALLEN